MHKENKWKNFPWFFCKNCFLFYWLRRHWRSLFYSHEMKWIHNFLKYIYLYDPKMINSELKWLILAYFINVDITNWLQIFRHILYSLKLREEETKLRLNANKNRLSNWVSTYMVWIWPWLCHPLTHTLSERSTGLGASKINKNNSLNKLIENKSDSKLRSWSDFIGKISFEECPQATFLFVNLGCTVNNSMILGLPWPSNNL